jgi:transcriptional regulator NrdR family protein
VRGGGDDRYRYVYIERARCPRCRSADLQSYRSTRDGDGSTSRHTQCRACAWRFIVVIE